MTLCDLMLFVQLIFYWILDTNRRRVIQVTLAVCTGAMAVGSEVVQGVIPVRLESHQDYEYNLTCATQNGRTFDYLDIFGNVAGSLAALGLNTMYHKRMLERKRAARGYRSIGGDEELGGAGLDDIELEEGTSAQESGVVAVAPQETATLDDDLDKWDENAEDWSDPDDEPTTTAPANGTSSVVKPPLPDMGKKRDD